MKQIFQIKENGVVRGGEVRTNIVGGSILFWSYDVRLRLGWFSSYRQDHGEVNLPHGCLNSANYELGNIYSYDHLIIEPLARVEAIYDCAFDYDDGLCTGRMLVNCANELISIISIRVNLPIESLMVKLDLVAV